MIRIETTDSMSNRAKITTENGQAVEGVYAVNIKMEPQSVTVAEIAIRVSAVDVLAHPLLSLETVREAAAAHGFILTPERA